MKYKLLGKWKYSIFQIYGIVLALYLLAFHKKIISLLIYPDILIGPVMVLGSFVAGSTFLGGGAVAFPALTKLFSTDPVSAKTFSLAIQSVGMTSASIYIILRSSFTPYKFLTIYIVGGGVGMFIGLFFLQGLIAGADIRIGFTLFIFCFLLIYLWIHKFHDKSSSIKDFSTESLIGINYSYHLPIIVAFGFLGGLISSLIGSGADLVIFCLLSLYYRINLKQAIQLSIIAMAAVSIIGTGFQVLVLDMLTTEVANFWFLAAPVVLFGTAIGVIFCRKVTYNGLLLFIIVIVMIELISTILLVEIDAKKIPIYSLLLIFSMFFISQVYRFSPHVER